MANSLDELTDPVVQQGRDTGVINKQLPVTVGFGSTLFQIGIWVVPALAGAAIAWPQTEPLYAVLIGLAAGLVCGLIWQYMKVKARNYFQQLEQKIQAEASNIDNYMEQRVVILENVAGLVAQAIKLDKEVFESIAALRSGITKGDIDLAGADRAASMLNFQLEAYPELKAHQAISDAMQQNNYLQREITAARTVYNNRVYQWNADIYDWPTKMIVAAAQGYTTRIPYAASSETKARSRERILGIDPNA